ncbi:hypothetical protein [Hydrocarboniclastica marina]|uniref:Bacterial virulence factor lipase N-terminal domain-containing protein n=1 Tax=Hydrocarboniclastica marina TaxID=2259620 RepID=A0A4P7XFM2_9ALTE|nr:hypothetical protein [Hydrocarboniclastica marina]QCF25726.1 hypothetical protein soil367_07235 [Hydrocarboniclastica marina]
MPNKTLISLAVASSIALTGCFDDGSSSKNADPDYKISSERYSGKTWPLFNPLTGALPIPSDLNFRSDNADTAVNEADGSFQIVTGDPNPVTEALNQLSGASTVAPPVVQFDGEIDASTVDARAFLMVDGSPVPNPNQNVFLIELDYASGDPVRGLSAGEPPTVPVAVAAATAAKLKATLEAGQTPSAELVAAGTAAAEQLAALAMAPAYEAEVVTLSGDSAIRINPTRPLEPFTRYVVAVTDEVLDINGDPIVASPTYSNLTLNGPDAPIINKGLAPVRRLINGFWEPTAAAYFQVTNSARGESKLSASDITLSYSFTTSNDERVLAYIADPATYFAETLTGALRFGAVEATLKNNPDASYDTLKAAADGAVAHFASTPTATALTEAGVFGAAAMGGCTDITISCAGVGLKIANSNPANPATVPSAADRSSTATFGAPQDVTLVSAVTSQVGINFGEINLVQGTIELPYYLSVPSANTASAGSVINTKSWEADATLAAQIGNQLGVNFGQSDPTNSKVVNYRFPFPKETAKVRVPVMVFYPNNAALLDSGTLPATIYAHGITADRSASLTFGSQLALNTQAAVIVIDQPVHGIAPFSTEEQRELAKRLLTAGAEQGLPEPTEANIDALIAGQLAYGTTAQILTTAGAINASDGISEAEDTQIKGTIGAALTSGTGNPQLDAAVRGLTSFENTVENAGSVVPGIAPTDYERHFNFTASAQNTPTPMNFDESNAVGESGSLFINLTNFTNSRDKNRQAVVDLLNIRASLGNLSFAGGAAADIDNSNVNFTGHSLGALVGAPFVAVANEKGPSISHTHLLTPGAGIVRLLENSPTFAPRILGGLAATGLQQGDAELETFFNVNQAALDSADPINFADNLVASDSKVLLSQVNGDQVIPNEAEVDPLGAAFKAYLSGTQPLAEMLNATAVTTATAPIDLNVNPAAITRYIAGTHRTPVLPEGGDLEERVFAEMIGQNAYMNQADVIIISDPQPSEIIQMD